MITIIFVLSLLIVPFIASKWIGASIRRERAREGFMRAVLKQEFDRRFTNVD